MAESDAHHHKVCLAQSTAGLESQQQSSFNNLSGKFSKYG